MTVIAFDGRYVAADKMAVANCLPRSVTKLHVFAGKVLAFNGGYAHGLAMVAWFRGGCVGGLPPCPDMKESAYLTVFEWGKSILQFEDMPVPCVFDADQTFAAGCGRDFAVAAMHCGKSAREAVEIASLYHTNCGLGVDVIDLREIASERVEVGGCAPAVLVGAAGDVPRARLVQS